MDFDSHIAGIVFGRPMRKLISALRSMECESRAMSAQFYAMGAGTASLEQEERYTILHDAAAILEQSFPPKHPTAMTPDELLDFAMRFVQDK